MKLVQMPTNLLRVTDADLDHVGIAPQLLAALRAYLPGALDDRRGRVIFTSNAEAGRNLLMVLARQIGAALRDENIRRRDSGSDMRVGKLRLCYLPGQMVPAALRESQARAELVGEVACFFQDLDAAWPASTDRDDDDGADRRPVQGLDDSLADEYPARVPLNSAALLGLLDERLAAGRPTFLNAAPDRLPAGLEDALRARLPTLEERSVE